MAKASIWQRLGKWHRYLAERVEAIPSSGTYLEIGTLNGCSLIAAYEGIKRSGNSVNLIAIDWYFIKLKYYKDRWEKLQKRCAHIPNLRYIGGTAVSVSDRVDDNSIDVLLDDSDSFHDTLVKHIRLYWPKIKDGGVWLGHDYQTSKHTGIPFVKRAYDDVFGDNGSLAPGTCLWVVEKVKGYIPKTQGVLDAEKVPVGD